MAGFTDIAILIALAALLGVLANKFKQPPLLGYILAGIIVGSMGIIGDTENESFELFAKIGITFLLFILGLELNIQDLRSLGKVSLVTGIGQIVFTTFFGYLLSLALGFNSTSAIFIAIGLTFSSTIVIIKLLSTKKELTTLHGKISIGFLLVQDLAAMLILMLLVTLGNASGGVSFVEVIIGLFIKIPIIVVLLWASTKYFLPWLINETNHDREVLFMVIIGWALFFAALIGSPLFGFTIEIGALLAGIALSSRKESLQIETWMRPLRDFFLTMFFVLLGLNLQIDSLPSVLIPALIFSTFVLIGNPIIVLIIMGALGYNKRTSFFTSLTVAQISEFSLLVAALGLQFGHLDSNAVAILTLVGGITMSISSYMIYYNQEIYEKLKKYLVIFEFRSHTKRGSYGKKMKGHVAIFGFHRLGEDIYYDVMEETDEFLIIDNNPMTVERLSKDGLKVIYGDMTDTDLYDHLKLEDAKLIVSTVPNKLSNLKLVQYINDKDIQTPIVITVTNDEDAKIFYEMGVDYVVYPHLLAGQKLKGILDTDVEIDEKLSRMATREIRLLNKRLKLDISV